MFQIGLGKLRWWTLGRVALALALGATLHSLAFAQTNLNPAPPLDPLPRITIPKLASTIKIDGDLREATWGKAVVIETLSRNDGTGRERIPTEVRLWYNDTALFLAWKCLDADILATFTNRDSHLWEEEAVEFFVTPGELNRYFEFQWNPLNAVFDAMITNRLDEHARSRGYQFDPTFTATNLTSAVKVNGTINNSGDQDKGWQIEAMIPFADLGQTTPKPNEVWRANFFRINRDTNQPTEFSSWSPTITAWFHQPNRFGSLEFGK